LSFENAKTADVVSGSMGPVLSIYRVCGGTTGDLGGHGMGIPINKLTFHVPFSDVYA